MNTFKNIFSTTLLMTFILLSSAVKAEILFTHEGDSIAYDETNNHYIITYAGLQGEINEVIWQPPTDINIEVESEFKVSDNGMIEYEYEFEVDKTSKLAFDSFYLYALAVDKISIESPEQWRVHVRDTYEVTDPTQRISWFTSKAAVQAGDEVDDFEFKSTALPVYTELYTNGKTDILSYIDYGPNVETQNYFNEEVLAKHINGKGFNTAIPLIPISTPFNAVETYTEFHQSLLGYIEKGFIDASIAVSIKDVSVAVLTALTANTVDESLSNLESLKKLIDDESEHSDDINTSQALILKELREILVFNLEFIKKQLTGEYGD